MVKTYLQSFTKQQAQQNVYANMIQAICDAYYRERLGQRPHIIVSSTPFDSRDEIHHYFVITDQPQLIETLNNIKDIHFESTDLTPVGEQDSIVHYPSTPPTKQEIEENKAKFTNLVNTIMKHRPK